ncbi:N-acetylmannosamine kinase [Enterobacter sp. ENT03]|uniref:N-acetylmannosamine kinase n=1 Tax=Enterobacter sp. ENT03 TaxID=2854780 RepID=UPI001C43C46C|nr:N-acetylmannosamine kinase [Enterobacter sp. ENT03]MBV7405043.1 N-acetylmannosamine kinase [Enterobacter sp. ENT03]
MTTLAIDIGGTKLAAALVDDEGRLSRRATVPTPASRTPDALEAALRDLLMPLCPQAQRFAIASTGIIQDGVLTAINPDNLGGLAQFPLVACVERLTALPGIALNDAQAAAWAEYQPLAARVRDMVFLTISTGVGGGVVRDGRLVIGKGGLAGHFGHTLADPHGPRCGCGRTGCVEAIASGRGIAAAAQDDLAGSDAKTIFALSAQGHDGAGALVTRSAEALARLIADVKAATDCQCVVLGGSIGLAPGYLTRVQTALSREPARYHTELLAAHYQHDAGLLGAAWWANGVKA